MRRYGHLSVAERDRVAGMRVAGAGVGEIAREVGRSASTVSREHARNGPGAVTAPSPPSGPASSAGSPAGRAASSTTWSWPRGVRSPLSEGVLVARAGRRQAEAGGGPLRRQPLAHLPGSRPRRPRPAGCRARPAPAETRGQAAQTRARRGARQGPRPARAGRASRRGRGEVALGRPGGGLRCRVAPRLPGHPG